MRSWSAAVWLLLLAACDRNRAFLIDTYVDGPDGGPGYGLTSRIPKDSAWLVGESHRYLVAQACPELLPLLTSNWSSENCWLPALPVTWRSENVNVATVGTALDGVATVKAIANGTTTIQAVGRRWGGLQPRTDTLEVRVATPALLRVTPAEVVLQSLRHRVPLRLVVTDQSGATISSFVNAPCSPCAPDESHPRVDCAAGDAQVARVSDGIDGMSREQAAMMKGAPPWARASVYATGPGETTVTCTVFGLTAEVHVTVPTGEGQVQPR